MYNIICLVFIVSCSLTTLCCNDALKYFHLDVFLVISSDFGHHWDQVCEGLIFSRLLLSAIFVECGNCPLHCWRILDWITLRRFLPVVLVPGVTGDVIAWKRPSVGDPLLDILEFGIKFSINNCILSKMAHFIFLLRSRNAHFRRKPLVAVDNSMSAYFVSSWSPHLL